VCVIDFSLSIPSSFLKLKLRAKWQHRAPPHGEWGETWLSAGKRGGRAHSSQSFADSFEPMREQSPIPRRLSRLKARLVWWEGNPCANPPGLSPSNVVAWWWLPPSFFLYLFYFFLLLSTTFRHQVCVCVLDGIS
jgi:hypothetical protein